MDLLAGNLIDPSRVYLNDGTTLASSASWTSSAKWTSAVAWGDYDNDGDLDIAFGNTSNSPSALYRKCGNHSPLTRAQFQDWNKFHK
ncbi:MAG: VCBS repeat-containing protein [Anaerolineales bacterium]|nr:VCBS repeat-containing protein [Anaerolineales bacterium]